VAPVIDVFLYSSVSALAAGLGILPFVLRERVPAPWLGWSKALAGGLMLGAAYVLVVEASSRGAVGGAAGACLGIAFVALAHLVWFPDARPGDRRVDTATMRAALHSAAEGIAIGGAWSVSAEFGAFVALAIAVHNAPEATMLCAGLRAGGASLRRAALVTIGANVPQIGLALAAFAVAAAAPALVLWTLGFAAGALVHLVLVDLLPDSYREAGVTSIALLTAVALGAVVLLESTSRAGVR
jgi:zinc transporter, ZIP family